MSRHHPYGGYDAPARRGGPGPGPGGPDRSFRHERGRGGGGRGGARGGSVPVAPRGSYGEAPPYANGYGGGGHTQGNGYDDAPHYAPEPHSAGGYYNEYGGGHAPAPAPAPSHESYDYQDSRAYEDGSSRGGPPTRRRPPRERDDHVHESLIEDRINRERPCRTLFIRNIKYETSSEDVRRRFEEFGEIKSFYDLVSSRGMVFVTYFDLRAAERARERLQNTEIAGRPIDVHYSLPRADEQNGRCDRDKNQGTLHLRLRNSPSGMPLDDHEVRRKFQQFGDVKGVRPAGGPMERLVEMYDTRACEDAHDKLRDQALQDGDMEINFAWDIPEQPLPNGPVPQRRFDDAPRGGSEEYGGGGGGDSRGRRGGDRGRGARGGGRSDRGGGGGGRGGRGGFRDDRDRGDYGHDDWDRGPPPPADNYGRGPPPGPPGAPMYGVPPQLPPQQHIPPPPVQSYAQPAPQAAAPDDRLEQARKVQQLLAALKNPAAPPAPTPPPAQPVNSYYTPPGAGMPAQVPTPTSYSPYAQSPVAPPAVPYYPPPPAAVAAPVQPPAAVSALPANLLSFLQQHQQQSPATPPPPAVSADPRLAAMQMPVSPTQATANPQAAALSNILGQLAMFGKRP